MYSYLHVFAFAARQSHAVVDVAACHINAGCREWRGSDAPKSAGIGGHGRRRLHRKHGHQRSALPTPAAAAHVFGAIKQQLWATNPGKTDAIVGLKSLEG